MQAGAIIFRFRVAILVAVIALGFWAPWAGAWGIASRTPLLEGLALSLSRMGLLRFFAATPAAIAIASLVAAAGAALRIWGTAYLGPGTVNNAEMKAGAVLADGPYRYVRNPLYMGSWFMIAAMGFIMPATGALLVMVLVTALLLTLIHGEETFLTAQLGEPYRDYLRAVPRIFPRLRTSSPGGGRKPNWARAVLSELNPIGVFLTLAIVSWSYDNRLMVQAILVSFGVSLVVRALLPGMNLPVSSQG
jgi:protein-S-isoprenylcysteine O-methyltransferase Ste14